MSEHTVFECELTGDRFGALNDVYALPLRHRRTADPVKVTERTVHLSIDAVSEHEVISTASIPSGNLEYIGVIEGEVVGMRLKGPKDQMGHRGSRWHDRDSVVIDHYERFLSWFEKEVLY